PKRDGTRWSPVESYLPRSLRRAEIRASDCDHGARRSEVGRKLRNTWPIHHGKSYRVARAVGGRYGHVEGSYGCTAQVEGSGDRGGVYHAYAVNRHRGVAHRDSCAAHKVGSDEAHIAERLGVLHAGVRRYRRQGRNAALSPKSTANRAEKD